ncbi:hypothetical protein SALBM311S_07428 [Streptomyces alboniger]
MLINTIGPVWDGNEVWLLTAGGATFAAFPEWYATLFSGFYLPLLLILVCLIVRGVAFEYRVKRPEENWQRNWETAIFWTSLIPAFLWGVAFGNIVRGVKIDQNFDYVGTFWDLLNPYALLGGLVTLTLFTFHGTVFIGAQDASGTSGCGRGQLRVGRRSGRSLYWHCSSCCGRRSTAVTARVWSRSSWRSAHWSLPSSPTRQAARAGRSLCPVSPSWPPSRCCS